MSDVVAISRPITTYHPAPDLLKDKVILLTGASGGIGDAVAKAYAQYGATVILLSENVPGLSVIYDDIVKNQYPEPAIYPMNLANATYDDYQDLATNIKNQLGRLDGVVHNAGMLGTLTPIEQYPLDQWYQVLQVNLNCTFLLTQALLPLLKQSDSSRIIITCANPDTELKAFWGAFGVAAAGALQLMKTLADEHQHTSININGICPDNIRTNLRNRAFPAESPKAQTKPQAIVPSYLYLMGKDSQLVNGQVFDPKKCPLKQQGS